jgi:hypothetical protein
MAEARDVNEILSELQVPPKPRKEKWRRVEACFKGIYAARDKGVPWPLIAQTLTEAGIDVSAADLRVFMSKIERDMKQYPQSGISHKPRKKVMRKTTRSSGVKSAVKPKSKTEEVPAGSPLETGTTRASQAGPLPKAPVPELQHAAQRRAGRKP